MYILQSAALVCREIVARDLSQSISRSRVGDPVTMTETLYNVTTDGLYPSK